MNDNQPNFVAETLAALRDIGRAKQAAHGHSHLKPRTPARLDPDQLAEAYRRERLRNPRRPHLQAAE